MKVSPDISRDEALAKLNLPAGKRFVTIVANLRNPVKDHPMFLRAAARVRATVPDAAFVIAGEGELMPGLRELAAELGIAGDVHFIGRCDDVATLLHASNVGVLSSKAEGFANAILEYMAAGLPVVATDVGGVREAIVEGKTGYVVASGDDEQMAQRLIQVLANDENARAMGLRGKAIVARKFSSEHHLRNTLELYDELLVRGSIRTAQSSIRQQSETAPGSMESFSLAHAFTPGIEKHDKNESLLKEA
jgi:glycosyltransferase involved in cell wall biosynthesis